MKTICISVVVVVSVLTCCSAAQDQEPVKSQQALVDQVVPQFDLVNGTLEQGIKKLARERMGNFGIEEILRDKFTDPPVANPQFSIHLANTTVTNVLDTLCRYDRRYSWSSDARSVNVYPTSTVGDPSYLLNRDIPQVSLQSMPDPNQALFAIDKQLPPPKEQLGYIQAGGDNTYSKPWTASFEHTTVRQFVNRITEHLGPSTIWYFRGSKQERLLMFTRLNPYGG